jgi:hypothetical protein
VILGFARGFLRQAELSCQRVKLVGKRRFFTLQHELAFANHMYQFDAGQDRARRSKRFETRHRPRDAFDRAVILLDNVVEIFNLPNPDRYFAFLVQLLQRCLVSAALVHRYLVGHRVVPYDLLEGAPGGGCISLGSQQEIDRLALLVDGSIQILPGAVDLDVCLIHPPAGTNSALVLSEGISQHWQKPDRPTVDRGMVNHHAAFLHDFFKMPIAQEISHVPANADQNQVGQKSHPFGIQHGRLLIFQRQQSIGRWGPPFLMRQNPIARMTPCLLELHFIVTLLAQSLFATGQLYVRGAAWHPKPQATFSDTIASIRRWLWSHEYFSTSLYEPDVIKIPRLLLDRFIDTLCYAA